MQKGGYQRQEEAKYECPQPAIHGRRDAARCFGQLRRGQPRLTRGTEPLEQLEFDAKIDKPGPVKAGQAADQIVKSIIEAHRGRIVARAGGTGYR